MPVQRLLLCLIVTLLFAEGARAQRSSRVTKSRLHFSNPKVRGHKAKIVCPTFDKSRFPLHGLGVKIGDPFALTYKFYPNKRLSFALDGGKSASGLYREYFKGRFTDYVAAAVVTENGDVTYLSHRVKSDVVVDARILYHINAEKLTEGLQLYVGAGWEWKQTQLEYNYERQATLDPLGSDPFGSFNHRRFTMGPQLALGIEYAYFTIPIAVFMEVEYFADLYEDPGSRQLQGGVGLRYIF